MKKYIVAKVFRDRQDKLRSYKTEEEYPAKGAPLSNTNRLQELVDKGFIIEVKKEEKKDVKKI